MRKLNFFSLVIPIATVFITSACIMIIELVAGRLIARYLGSSLYTWTSVIGIVLAGITIGNYIGGRIADRFNAQKTLACLFGLASLACVVVIILNNSVGEWIWLWKFAWPMRVFCHVSIVFLFPSILLGTISPVVVKMGLDIGLPTGRTVGDIYAWGAAGSIAGTFLAGFYLIATMGTIAIIWVIGVVLLFMGILYWFKFWPLYIWAIIYALLFTMGMAPVEWTKENGPSLGLREQPDASVLYQAETPYCYVAVRQLSQKPDIREFVQDKLRHSEIDMDDVTKLQYFYTNIYAGITHGLSEGKQNLSMMVIGGGGYAFPQYLEKEFPNSNIEVVEIDPGVTEAAIQAFGLDRNTPIRTISLDARNYIDQIIQQESVNGRKKRFDFIFEDAINDYSVPFQLVTKEFNEKIDHILTEDGVYMVNLIDTYDNGQFLGAVINTVKKTFPYTFVVTNFVSLPSLRDTFVVVASKKQINPEQILSRFSPNLKFRYLNDFDFQYLTAKSDNIILTDDYAPVENMLAPVVKQSAVEILAYKYLRQAEKLKVEKNWNEAIKYYEKAYNLNPSMTIKACNEIGFIQVCFGDLKAAANTFQKAIDYHYSNKTSQNVIASIYLNLAVVYLKMNQPEIARKQFEKAVEQFHIELNENPDSAETWNRLGDTYASIGDFKSATDAFKKAFGLEPANPNYFDNIAKSLEYQGRYEELIVLLENQIKILSKYNPAEAHQLQQYKKAIESKSKK